MKNIKLTLSIFGGLFIAIMLLAALNIGSNVERQVAEKAIQQYEIARQHGSAMDRYVAAGFVKAAMLQAEDDAGYAVWSKIERQEGRAAGLR